MPSTRDSFQSEARYTGHGSFGTRIASGDDNDHYGPFSTSTQMSPTSDENRGKRRPRDDEHVDDQDSQAEDGDASPGSLKKRRIRKGLEKKFECPHEGCGKSYSRAEHLYRHQLNHNPKQLYYCDFPDCQRSFIRQDLCARHKERHTARGSQLLRKDTFMHNLNPIMTNAMANNPEKTDNPQSRGYNWKSGEDVKMDIPFERLVEPEKATSPHTQTFSLGPKFIDFVSEELQKVKDVLEVIVVTGTEDLAFVAPCAEYAEKTWPEFGRPLLLSLVLALRPLKDFQHTHSQRCLETLQNYDLGRDLSMSASLFKDSAPTDQLRIELEVQGKPKDVSEIAQIFKWLSAVCRKPVPDKLLCSRVLDVTSPTIRRTEFHTEPLEPPLGTGGSGRCWNNMFKGYVLAEGFPIPERGSQRGAELPFDVMTLLGLALYPINFGQGIILKGENTALIPSVSADDENCVQWHYLEGDGAGGPLTWDRIKQHCGNIYPSKDFKLLQSKRTFVGYFPSVKVHLGTRDSGFDKVDFSGAEYDDKTAFVLGNELVGQVGTSVMNFFTAQVSAKLMVHQTAHQRLLGVHDNIMDKIRNSKDFPILLFDFKTKQGWLVSELSAILHMALAWASYQHQSADVLSSMPFAEARPDGGMAAYDAILRSADLLLPEHIKLGDNNDRQVSIRQAFVPFFLRIGQIKDQQLQRYACGIKESKDLVGYEFKEIASFEEHLHLRRSKVDVDKSGGWLRLVSSKPEMAVILCSNLEAPIQPASTQRVCPFWQTVPTDQYYLTASVSCLRQLAKRCGGEESLRLYNDIYCIPPKKDPGPGVCGTRNWPCCNPLLELSKHPSKKVLRFDDEGALIIGKAVPHTEDNNSLRIFWRSLSSGKDEKAQNGNFSVLQSNHQTLTGTVNPPLPQNSVSSGMP